MTQAKFLQNAEPLKVRLPLRVAMASWCSQWESVCAQIKIFGNELEGEARSFSSNNMGWYVTSSWSFVDSANSPCHATPRCYDGQNLLPGDCDVLMISSLMIRS